MADGSFKGLRANRRKDSVGASMHRELRKQIKEATEKSGINKLDFIALLRLIDQHYDKMEETVSQTLSETLSQSLASQSLASTTPIEVIFDSVTDDQSGIGAYWQHIRSIVSEMSQ